jgi:hypothetical protein
VTAEGHALFCGYNFCGQLGVGDRTNRLGFTLGGRRAARGREDRDGGVRMAMAS